MKNSKIFYSSVIVALFLVSSGGYANYCDGLNYCSIDGNGNTNCEPNTDYCYCDGINYCTVDDAGNTNCEFNSSYCGANTYINDNYNDNDYYTDFTQPYYYGGENRGGHVGSRGFHERNGIRHHNGGGHSGGGHPHAAGGGGHAHAAGGHPHGGGGGHPHGGGGGHPGGGKHH